MTTFFMTLYILMWPALAAVVLVILTIGVIKDVVYARKNGEPLV